MAKQKGSKEARKDQAKRTHKKTIAFNEMELKVIQHFVAKYKIKNQSKLFRESIITTMLKKMEEDHPKLF